jgi:flavin-binding protein dodecin
MAVIKVIEILAASTKSWKDAAQSAVGEATRALRNIRSAFIRNLRAEVQNGKITSWRLNGNIAFEKE